MAFQIMTFNCFARNKDRQLEGEMISYSVSEMASMGENKVSKRFVAKKEKKDGKR